MTKRFCILAIFLLNFIFVYGQNDTNFERILITEIHFGKNLEGLNYIKVEAAMNLAARLAGRYQIIPLDIRDSVAKALQERKIPPTAYSIGKELSASQALIIKINRFANLLRVDFASFNFSDSSVHTSKGYSTIRYYQKEKNSPLLDPALLAACQRAFAELIAKPEVYQNLEGSFKVKPAPTLAIGSINYIEDDSTRKWTIFHEKQVSSFFAIETIFEIARQSPDYVVLDNATRDSIYAYFNLYEPENFNKPTPEEVKALLDFEIEYYITGELFFENGKVVLRLYLCKITEEGLEILDEKSEIVQDDLIEKYKEALENATKKLLKISEG
jgi:hypothetical protein